MLIQLEEFQKLSKKLSFANANFLQANRTTQNLRGKLMTNLLDRKLLMEELEYHKDCNSILMQENRKISDFISEINREVISHELKPPETNPIITKFLEIRKLKKAMGEHLSLLGNRRKTVLERGPKLNNLEKEFAAKILLIEEGTFASEAQQKILDMEFRARGTDTSDLILTESKEAQAGASNKFVEMEIQTEEYKCENCISKEKKEESLIKKLSQTKRKIENKEKEIKRLKKQVDDLCTQLSQTPVLQFPHIQINQAQNFESAAEPQILPSNLRPAEISPVTSRNSSQVDLENSPDIAMKRYLRMESEDDSEQNSGLQRVRNLKKKIGRYGTMDIHPRASRRGNRERNDDSPSIDYLELNRSKTPNQVLKRFLRRESTESVSSKFSFYKSS